MIHAFPPRPSFASPPQTPAAPEPSAAGSLQTVPAAAPETVQTKITRNTADTEHMDIDQMINQVYDQLEKRLKFDRRRTGLM
jgi:hypothetical protein